MAETTLIAGSAALFVSGFVSWYTIWHRRTASSVKRLPVSLPKQRSATDL